MSACWETCKEAILGVVGRMAAGVYSAEEVSKPGRDRA